jgi:O-antigen/teichoic acid export membrane protein
MCVEVTVLWATHHFRPRFRLSLADLAPLRTFSAGVLAQDIISWLVLYADALIVAAFLDIQQLGKYRLGTVLVTGGFAALFVPADKVLFSLFSKYPDSAAVGRSLYPLMMMSALIALPIGLLLMAAHSEIETVFFPSKWDGVGFVIGVIGLREAVAYTVFAVDAAYKGVGRPDIIFKVRMINLLLLLSVQIFALQYGFEAFLLARLLGTVVALGVILIVVTRFFGPPQIVWTRCHRLAVVLLLLVAVVAVTGSLVSGWHAASVVAVVALLMPLALLIGRVVRSFLSSQV